MYGNNEVDLKFPTPIPVNITYQTAFVDDAGKLQFRKDIYGRDATMIALMRNKNGKDLETVIAHSEPSYSRPTYVPDPGSGFAAREPSFFDRLFGAPQPYTQRHQSRVFTR